MEQARYRVAIIGTGNIGTDLLVKLSKEPSVELVMFAGVDPDSPGIQFARELGVAASAEGISAITGLDPLPHLVLDATTARAHIEHAAMLADLGVAAIDLTPAAVGPMTVPVVNLTQHLDAPNINMISCAAQATLPLVCAVGKAMPLDYVETVTTIASKSAGPGTRANIDAFASKTSAAISTISGAKKAKAIALLNPADPPLSMRNTIYIRSENDDDLSARVREEVESMVAQVQSYVPGYQVHGLTVDRGAVTIFNEVVGAGDFLPTYAGNLDIITAAATAIVRAKAARTLTEVEAGR